VFNIIGKYSDSHPLAKKPRFGGDITPFGMIIEIRQNLASFEKNSSKLNKYGEGPLSISGEGDFLRGS
jgi:hypothetical protein